LTDFFQIEEAKSVIALGDRWGLDNLEKSGPYDSLSQQSMGTLWGLTGA
jgi:hypothetical protein